MRVGQRLVDARAQREVPLLLRTFQACCRPWVHSPPALPPASGLPTLWFTRDVLIPGKCHLLSGLWAFVHALPSTWSPLSCIYLQAGLGHSDPPSGLNLHVPCQGNPYNNPDSIMVLLEMPYFAWGHCGPQVSNRHPCNIRFTPNSPVPPPMPLSCPVTETAEMRTRSPSLSSFPANRRDGSAGASAQASLDR